MEKWDWSAIIAGIAVLISLIALWFQRNDLKKQAKYQRDTFNLQNTIDRDNITFGLAGDIIGNIQTQVQLMKMLFQETNLLNSWNENKGDGIDSELKTDQILKFERSIDELNSFRKDLTNDLTSKGNSLQFHMGGEEELERIQTIFLALEKMITKMSGDIHKLSYNNIILSDEELEVKLDKFDSDALSNIGDFQNIMMNIKQSSLDKLSKID